MNHPAGVLAVVGAMATLTIGCAGAGDVLSVQQGDCVDVPGDQGTEVAHLPVVDCDEPHENQVYAVIEQPDGSFPGQEPLLESAQEACLLSFEPFVGLPYEDSELFASWIVPTSSSWEAGDREVVCLVFDPEDPLVGSVEGTNR